MLLAILKEKMEDYLLLMDRVTETAPVLSDLRWRQQAGRVDMQTKTEGLDWFQERNEWLVFVVCGRNIPFGRAERCLRSLRRQSIRQWQGASI